MNTAGMQEQVANEVNSRLAKATEELKEKYARGEGGKDVSIDGPSGKAYQEKRVQELKEKKARRAQREAMEGHDEPERDLSDGELDDLEDKGADDYELQMLRQQRLKQIKQAHTEKVTNIAKGHGQYREISQDEFLAEVTSSLRVICHFFHRDFPRCTIMDHHLAKLAQTHIETKFIKINADKAPFFIEKLKIRTIPSVIIFHDGIATEKILGFEGLTDGLPEGKEDEWSTIRLAYLLAEKKAISKENIVDEEGIARENAIKMESMRKALMSESLNNFDNDDFDLED